MKPIPYNEHCFSVRWSYDEPSIKRMHQLVYLQYLMITERYFHFKIFGVERKKTLDIGCASGHLMEILKKLGHEVYGLDISKHAIKRAPRGLNDSVPIIHDAQTSLPFREKFDLITCFEVLEHLKEPQRAIENSFSALREGAIFLATTPNKFSPVTWYIRESTHINEKSKGEWERILRRFNWTKVKCFIYQRLPIKNLVFKFPLFGHTLLIVAQK